MRIRRSAKLSPAQSTADRTCPEELLQAHVCNLSQSPWDIAIVAQSSANTQREGCALEDFSFTRNGSLGADSIGAVESVTSSMMDIGKADNGTETTIMPVKRRRRRKKTTSTTTTTKTTDHEVENIVVVDNAAKKSKNKSAKQIGNKGTNSGNNTASLCQKNDGKGWQCKRSAKDGSNFCEHHLSLFRSYNTNTNSTANYNTTLANNAAHKSTSSAAPEGRRKRANQSSNNNNNNNNNNPEFYYYSGFGPRWGRRRGGGNGRGRSPEADGDDGSKLAGVAGADSSSQSPSDGGGGGGGNAAAGGNSELDFVDFEDEDEDEDEDSDGGGDGRKRVRRPVKARSLKSLM